MDQDNQESARCNLKDGNCKTGACTEAKCSHCVMTKILLIGAPIFFLIKYFVERI